ncbi:3'(2'),5'-bisphosphate nucleotidase CysQ [Aureitalea marina]|uniref:3'(2'),5'-bisphosphate nucleotidase CysQ n=1 Tax=Aureitalea marina TaxID=930804 RepID=A0A2S7KNM3_9FLAO|nr:3'(2'),5'-bisphosphate nucleotidase CysQ [Aureitalea marina]PQB04222.1 3'(2'),5'-bisphosphate nucleotidase [Aureitalea marina]
MNTNLNLAIIASIRAGEAIMEVYSGPFDIELKGDESPLTEADKKANDVINSFLTQTDIPIISEENKQVSYDERQNWNRCWIVDPLDGTKEFIKRNGEFTVNIALVENGNPVMGVIFVPVSRTLYFNDPETEQSYRMVVPEGISNEFTPDGAEGIHYSAKADQKIRVVGSRSHLNKDTQDFIDSLGGTEQVEIVSKGSSLKFCLVAEGQADVYPRFAPTMEWDTAAGQAICQSAGVEVIDQNTDRPLQYNKANLLNPYFKVGAIQ